MNHNSMRLPHPDPKQPDTLWLVRWNGDKTEREYASIDSFTVNAASGTWEAILRTKRGLEYVDSHGHAINIFAWHPIDWAENHETNTVSPPAVPVVAEPAPVEAAVVPVVIEPEPVEPPIEAAPADEVADEVADEIAEEAAEEDPIRVGGEVSQAVMRRRTSRGK